MKAVCWVIQEHLDVIRCRFEMCLNALQPKVIPQSTSKSTSSFSIELTSSAITRKNLRVVSSMTERERADLEATFFQIFNVQNFSIDWIWNIDLLTQTVWRVRIEISNFSFQLFKFVTRSSKDFFDARIWIPRDNIIGWCLTSNKPSTIERLYKKAFCLMFAPPRVDLRTSITATTIACSWSIKLF